MTNKYPAPNPRDIVALCRDCGSKDLYLQKDFPRKIAIPIILAGMITVPWTYGISLLVVALIDFILYRRVAWMTVCYRCHAEYRGFTKNPSHKEFDRHVDELYQYGK